MRVAAGTDDPVNANPGNERFSVNEVDDVAIIVSVDVAITFTFAIRTDLQLGAKGLHGNIKKRFCGTFYLDKVAI